MLQNSTTLSETMPRSIYIDWPTHSPEGGEYEDSHHEEEHEEAELLVAVLQREGDRLQPGRVARQLEDTHDPHYPEDLRGRKDRSVPQLVRACAKLHQYLNLA